jgi:hypothetical protein
VFKLKCVLSQVIVGEGESVLLQFNSTRMITDNQVLGIVTIVGLSLTSSLSFLNSF